MGLSRHHISMDSHLRRLLCACAFTGLVASSLSGCGRFAHSTTIPTDVPLSQFALGRWRSVSVYGTDGSEISLILEIAFGDEDTLMIAELNSRGELIDADTAQYQFIDPTTISVLDPRVGADWTWRLQRDGEMLLIYRELYGKTDHMILERLRR